MSSSAIIALAAAIAIAVSTIGPAIAQGIASKSAMDAIARQPGEVRRNPLHSDHRPGADRGADHLRAFDRLYDPGQDRHRLTGQGAFP